MIVKEVYNLKIELNGKNVELNKELSLMDFIVKEKGLNPNKVVVELNARIADKAEWEIIMLKANDKLEVIKFVGGG